MAGYGEDKVCRCLNKHFMENQITAFAFRLKQYKYAKQYTDIIVDSLSPDYFMALEVKSKRGKYALNFNSDFTIDEHTKEHQLDRQCEFSRRTGRIAYVVLYCRQGAGKPVLCYVFESSTLKHLKDSGKVSILASEFDEYNQKESVLWELLNK